MPSYSYIFLSLIGSIIHKRRITESSRNTHDAQYFLSVVCSFNPFSCKQLFHSGRLPLIVLLTFKSPLPGPTCLPFPS